MAIQDCNPSLTTCKIVNRIFGCQLTMSSIEMLYSRLIYKYKIIQDPIVTYKSSHAEIDLR